MFLIGLVLLIVGAVVENRELTLIGCILIAVDLFLAICLLAVLAISHSVHFGTIYH